MIRQKGMITLNKKDVLIFGMILEADMYKEGFGTTKEDEKLLRKALQKVYKVSDDSSEEIKDKTEEQFEKDQKDLTIEYRRKVEKFLVTHL